MLSRRALLLSSVAILALAGDASAWPRRANGLIQPPNATIPVSTLSNGNYAANAFPGFTTPATTVSSGTITTNPDNSEMLCFSTGTWRDQEITVNVGGSWRGTLYLRMAGGQALYLNCNGQTGPEGSVQVGVVQGFVPANADFGGNGTFYAAYYDQSPGTTWPGWMSATSITFGCSGFGVYVKMNGTTQLLAYDEWRICQSGTAAAWAHPGVGVGGNISVDYLALAPLFSNPSASVYDPRDFGMRSVAAVTGSISSGSNSLALASNVGFQVGDQVIVEIGGEAGAGARGTIGVGGTWPILNYPNLAAMQADTSQAVDTCGYLQSNMSVLQWNGSAWSTSVSQQVYYPTAVVPLSLVAKVTAVSTDGKTLTLSANAAVAATNANVWLDCLPSFYPINQALVASPTYVGPGGYAPWPTNMTITIPAGIWRLSGIVQPVPLANAQPTDSWAASTGLRVHGAGRTLTTLQSPKGTTSGAINFSSLQVNNVTISDMAYVGNMGDNGYGFSINMSGNGFAGYPSAFTLGSIGAANTGLLLQKLDGTNTFGNCCGALGQGALINDCTCTLTNGQRDYVGWQMQCADSAQPTIQNCTVTGAFTVKSFELFACNGGTMIGCGGQNCIFSTNSSTSWTIDCRGKTNTITAGAWFSSGATGIDEPIYNISDHAFGSGNTGTFYPGITIQQGYVLGTDVFKFVQVEAAQTNVQIIGAYPDGGAGCSGNLDGYFEAPDWTPTSNEYGPILYIDGANCTVSGIRVKGTAISSPGHSGHWGNISNLGTDGVVQNSVADVVQPGPSGSGNQTNAAYCP